MDWAWRRDGGGMVPGWTVSGGCNPQVYLFDHLFTKAELVPAGVPYESHRRGGILPDPVALREVRAGLIGLGNYDCSSVILLVPPHGVEHELAVRSAAIYQWRASGDVVRKLLEETGAERFKRFGILPFGQAVAFQGARHIGFVHACLAEGKLGLCPGD